MAPLHGDALSITGQTMAEVLRDVPEAPRNDQEVIRPWDRPLYPHGHLAILRGNLAHEGGVAKITGVKTPRMTGPARVFRPRGGLSGGHPRRTREARRRTRHSLRGAERRSGHAGDALTYLGPHRRGAR